MFGIGETAAAISGILSALRALNEGIATVKESGANAGSLGALVSRYSTVEQKIQEVEQAKAGILTVKQSLDLSLAKRQAETFNRQLRDAMLMTGQANVYNEVIARVDESKAAHAKSVANLKKARAKRRKELKEVALVLSIAFGVALIAIAGVAFWMR